MATPDCDAWVNTAIHPHLITTLLPMAAVKQVGGFDESLPGFEDADLYLKLRSFGWCGVRVTKPLFHYHGDGQRSESFKQNPQREWLRAQVHERYKYMADCGGCGGSPPAVESSDRQLGDVLAKALYAPSTQFGVPVNGSRRFYKRTFYQGQDIWVSPHDAQAFPHLWHVIRDPSQESPDVDTVMALARAAFK